MRQLLGSGQGGNIDIKARSLSVTNGAFLGTSTVGKGDAGDITIQTEDKVSFDGLVFINDIPAVSGAFTEVERSSGLAEELVGTGKGGDIRITVTAGSLSLTNGAQLATATAGKIGERGSADAGNIDIDVSDTLLVSDGSVLRSNTTGEGRAGRITIQAEKGVNIFGVGMTELPRIGATNGVSSGLYTTTEADAIGQGGEIKVTTNTFRLADAAVLSARTRSSFRGGDITVNANNLELTGGGQILATTFSSGDAGSINLNVDDNITIAGSDPSFSQRIETFGQQIVANDSSASGLFVRSQLNMQAQKPGNAGQINVTVPSLNLENQGIISAATASGQGGNINLQVQDILVLRRGSQITTTAGTAQAGGDGGNITINTDVLVGLNNSDITANAFGGLGGKIEITAQGIFGIQQRTREELQTQLGIDDPVKLDPTQLSSSDITAISQTNPALNGQIIFNTPDVDPSSGLIELPQTIVDPDALIAQNPCTLGRGSEFIVTGRGGLPPSPGEALSSRTVRVSLVEPTQPSTTGSNIDMTVRSPRSASLPIVPAQGWILNEKGQVVFTAYDPTGTASNRMRQNPPTCPAR
ncbi:beta strand repeat-containing protein [Microseira wollei]|uniref:Hemagglutination activity domain protein n=1 Tax=Microseira wollei NIES-4236 TaxID=2530354 RepID=A0AAV3XES3_9CYAN|nr:S-layer family protein [Microseira wollei]GET39973.1 hemagglutination activity domain protein [Microseira wollei NIES-4236]